MLALLNNHCWLNKGGELKFIPQTSFLRLAKRAAEQCGKCVGLRFGFFNGVKALANTKTKHSICVVSRRPKPFWVRQKPVIVIQHAELDWSTDWNNHECVFGRQFFCSHLHLLQSGSDAGARWKCDSAHFVAS